MQLELIADYACVTGEGPLWHPTEKRVYWLDIPQGRLVRHDPASQRHEPCYEGPAIGGFTIQQDGSLLFFMAKGAIARWRGGTLEYLVEEIPDERETRFNDVIADPAGRVFCGTMSTSKRAGRLYRLDLDGTLTLVLEGIGCSNGMGFTLDRKQMYYTDSTKREIYRFDYDIDTGDITHQEVLISTEGEPGVPDGMTVDAEGYLWSARWDGYCLVRYAPDGTEVRRVEFPTKKVSCVTFGGEDYADMYVTTAGGNDKHENGQDAGALYRLNLGIQGLPEFVSRIEF